jgi:dihydroflavonol-4-reductase
MKVLVIGGSGFIGLNIVDALLAAGHTVRATRRRSTPTMFLRKRAVELVNASLEERPLLRQAMEGCDAVVLAGAPYPRYSLDRERAIATGVSAVENACEAALDAGVARFVFTSSIAVLGAPPHGRRADERDVATEVPSGSVYRAVKWEMERVVTEAALRGLPAVSLLPGGCLGPWDVRVGTGALLVGTVRGAIPWWTDGIVNVVDVADVASAHVAALDAACVTLGGRYCLAGHNVRVRTLLETIVGRYGGSMPPEELSHEEARLRADDEERRAAPRGERVAVPREFVDVIASGQPVSSARASAVLGVRTRPLEETLDRAHAWFTRFRYLPGSTPKERPAHDHV